MWSDSEELSIYYRKLQELAFEDVVITPRFARETRVEKVQTIIHEDLHFNDEETAGHNAEAFVTPLGYLAALEFFKMKGNMRAIQLTQLKINYYRQLSQVITMFAQTLKRLFKTFPLREAYYRASYCMPPLYKNYSRGRRRKQRWGNPLEAIVSHDFLYWKYFNDVVGLSEKVNDFKTLFEIIKNVPEDRTDIKRYFRKFEKK